jgi:hypothetical protein
MKRLHHLIWLVLLFSTVHRAYSQASATATRLGTFQAGLGVTAASPDYGQLYIKGYTAYADFNFSDHIGVEAVPTRSASSPPPTSAKTPISSVPVTSAPTAASAHTPSSWSVSAASISSSTTLLTPRPLTSPMLSAAVSTSAPPNTSTSERSTSKRNAGPASRPTV